MHVIIRSNSTQGHMISKYQFKVLGVNNPVDHTTTSKENNTEHNDFVPLSQSNISEADEKNIVNSHKEEESKELEQVEQSPQSKSSKDELIESLLKKVDDVTSNFIKVQMKLEDAQELHVVQLEEAKKEAFEEGIQEGLSRAKADSDAANSNSVEQFAKSIQTLEGSAQNFSSSLTSIQDDLLNAALEIAKEVIDIEVNSIGNEIALKLSEGLIEELKTASKITLKVNPNNHGILSEKLGKLQHIEIISDSAVSPGGVIVFSDAGNIDSQIEKRFEKVKEAALSGE